MRLALIVVLLSAPALASAEAPVDVAKRIEAFYKEKPEIQAVFLQKVKKPGRRRVLKKRGEVFFKRPGMMRWDYSRPEKVHYVSDGNVLWSYQPEDALVTRLDVKSSELYHQSRYLFGQGNLSEDFELSVAPAGVAKADQDGLVLKPKKSSRDFKSLTLVVDKKTGEIRTTILVDPYDNESTIIFEKTEYKTLNDTVFQFTPPKNTTVRDLSKQGGKGGGK